MIKEFQEEFKNIALDEWVKFINKFVGKQLLCERYDKTKVEQYTHYDGSQKYGLYKIGYRGNSRYGDVDIGFCLYKDAFMYCITINPFYVSFPFNNDDEFFAETKKFINQHCPHYQEAIKEEIELRAKQIKDEVSM